MSAPPGVLAPPDATPPAPPARLRILVCDDSTVIRAALARMLEAEPGLHVVARARNGEEAVAAVRRGGIDVAVTDIEMPVMDGLTALPLMLAADPGLRVIVVSTLTTRGGAAAMEALRRGAADCLPKPASGEDAAFARELVVRVPGQGGQRRRLPDPAAPTLAVAARPAPAVAASFPAAPPRPPRSGLAPAVIAIGASTGGPQALAEVFRAFRRPPALPILLTQHMPAAFIPMLAEHLGRMGAARVEVAREGTVPEPGCAYLAPGGVHLLAAGRPMALHLSDAPEEHFCRPAVDPMLRSLAALLGERCVAAVLTGMGHDGGAGAAAVRAAGGHVLAQDAASSVVWGMPGAVVERGAAQEVLPLPALARRLAELAGAA
ncbi:chemotaxis-specific protein-glutamate methyltransferase CheB [Teichococcus aestuarii]|uniref:chemotaxis-specific protein-glutamate methyltransferase CheB n=1 Tax=Teichococcus aestuarii TaxID=568898 RepID=UPI00360F6264